MALCKGRHNIVPSQAGFTQDMGGRYALSAALVRKTKAGRLRDRQRSGRHLQMNGCHPHME